MRPLYHPSVDELTVEGILYALSDPVRVRIFAQLAMADCAKNCSTFLQMGKKTLPKSTLSQHMKVLRESGLIRSERQGTEVRNYARCEELAKRFGPLLTAIVDAYQKENRK